MTAAIGTYTPKPVILLPTPKLPIRFRPVDNGSVVHLERRKQTLAGKGSFYLS